jgi:hypothetical protein
MPADEFAGGRIHHRDATRQSVRLSSRRSPQPKFRPRARRRPRARIGGKNWAQNGTVNSCTTPNLSALLNTAEDNGRRQGRQRASKEMLLRIVAMLTKLVERFDP